MNTSNSMHTTYVDTAMHRCTVMAEDVAYPLETLHQGRDAKNSVPRISMLSGIPRTEEDDEFRATVWRIAFVVLIAVWCGLAAVAVRAGYAYGILR